MSQKVYAGIGNPDTPPDILAQMVKIAQKLSGMGYTVRTSGGGPADDTFETNTSQVEVYLPWKNFNKKTSQYVRNHKDAPSIVKPFHPTFDSMTDAVKAIIARHAHVILGPDLNTPVDFLICWSQDGIENGDKRSIKSGYMSIPVALAASRSIPVFNLKNVDAIGRFRNFIEL